jgi:uncharacterized phage protein (TIGR02218 family)
LTLPASPQLAALLGSTTSFLMADLYTFTLSQPPQVNTPPVVLRYSGAPVAVNVNGLVYPMGPAFERAKTRRAVGTQVDTLDLLVYPHINSDPDVDQQPSDMIGGLTWPEATWRGVLDGATLALERAFMPSYGDTSPGTVLLFLGRVSQATVSRTAVELSVASQLELLNIQMPRRVWQSPCTHLFGGPMCLFNRASMAAVEAAMAGSTQGSITTALAPNPIGLYNQGTISGLTGGNTGIPRTITQVVGGVVTVKPIFLYPVATGDTFQLLPGCDRTFATCSNTFNNAVHFGGFDQVPSPETAL